MTFKRQIVGEGNKWWDDTGQRYYLKEPITAEQRCWLAAGFFILVPILVTGMIMIGLAHIRDSQLESQKEANKAIHQARSLVEKVKGK